jgi:hypothetical protein
MAKQLAKQPQPLGMRKKVARQRSAPLSHAQKRAAPVWSAVRVGLLTAPMALTSLTTHQYSGGLTRPTCRTHDRSSTGSLVRNLSYPLLNR